HAAHHCTYLAMRALLDKGGEPDVVNEIGRAPSRERAEAYAAIDRPEKLELLLSVGAKVSLCSVLADHGKAQLLNTLAAIGRSDDVINVCGWPGMKSGVINYQDEAGWTALHHAAHHCTYLAMRALLDKGGEPDVVN